MGIAEYQLQRTVDFLLASIVDLIVINTGSTTTYNKHGIICSIPDISLSLHKLMWETNKFLKTLTAMIINNLMQIHGRRRYGQKDQTQIHERRM